MKKITRFLKADIEYNKQEYEDVLEENIKKISLLKDVYDAIKEKKENLTTYLIVKLKKEYPKDIEYWMESIRYEIAIRVKEPTFKLKFKINSLQESMDKNIVELHRLTNKSDQMKINKIEKDFEKVKSR